MGAILDGNAVTAVFTQPRTDGAFPSGLAEYLNAISLRRPVLLFAFAPKAAGTFLRSAAIDAVGGQLVRISHALGGRDAQPYLPVFINYYLGGMCDGPLVAHAHMQALPANRHFLEILGIRPIIMLRSIPDMLASYWDMLAQSAQARAEGLNCVIPEAFADFSSARKADFMIDMIAPWYVSYFATWLAYKKEDPQDVCTLHFADFVKDPAAALETALKHAEFSRTRAQCQHALDSAWDGRGELRFNKGTEGRGREYFSSAHWDRLARMLSFHPVLAEYAAELL
ncbi:MAG: hypothetical protein JSR55_02960 [Proteobacteria bacterium]|nr:hypothetical protein [Pseudomonadota bacterium]